MTINGISMINVNSCLFLQFNYVFKVLTCIFWYKSALLQQSDIVFRNPIVGLDITSQEVAKRLST